MGKMMNQKVLHVLGMTCSACEAAVEKAINKIPGVKKAKASFLAERVEYLEKAGPVDLEIIKGTIEAQGYKVVVGKPKAMESEGFTSAQFIGIGIIIFSAFIIIKNTIGFNIIPEISPSMGYIALFIVGLVTSLHCVAMCGGINISQCMKASEETATGKLKPSLLYNGGRVLSYTIIGGLAGAIGSAVSFSGMAKGLVAIVAGIFMIIMGLNLFGTFPWIKKITPRIPGLLKKEKGILGKGKGPLVVGILNGLMPCGPLQAMQLYALGTGSFLAGATSMFFFSLGTVPLMLGLGIFSTFMSGKFSKRMMQVGAVLVMTLGFVMLSRGMAISGISIPTANGVAKASATETVDTAKLANGVQNIETKLAASGYPAITVTKGIPVHWNMKADAADITGCNGTLVIPEYNIEKKLQPGDNIIEFTPKETGSIPYSCWMGMIRSKINVVENSGTTTDSLASSPSSIPSGGGGCCGGSSTSTDPKSVKVEKAVIKKGIQQITVNVDNLGYDPGIIVMQKGVKAQIKFKVKELSGCNSQVYFSLNDMSLDFSKKQYETAYFTPKEDIAFSCGMGMLNGYIKIVPDLGKADVKKIKNALLGN